MGENINFNHDGTLNHKINEIFTNITQGKQSKHDQKKNMSMKEEKERSIEDWRKNREKSEYL